jgi:glutamyl/glutaminyl-tRNA synthetase
MGALTNFDIISLEQLVENYAAANNNKAFYYFPILRLLLTGEAGGPPLFDICAFLGKKEVLERINHSISLLEQ